MTMTKLLSVKDIQARYQCNPVTARKYIREMDHMESPLMVSETAVAKWERERTVLGASEMRRRKMEGKRNGLRKGC